VLSFLQKRAQEAAKEKLHGLKRLFDRSWWTECVEKGWKWVKDDVSAGFKRSGTSHPAAIFGLGL